MKFFVELLLVFLFCWAFNSYTSHSNTYRITRIVSEKMKYDKTLVIIDFKYDAKKIFRINQQNGSFTFDSENYSVFISKKNSPNVYAKIQHEDFDEFKVYAYLDTINNKPTVVVLDEVNSIPFMGSESQERLERNVKKKVTIENTESYKNAIADLGLDNTK